MRRSNLSTLVARSARFGATVTLLTCALAIAAGVTAYRQTVPAAADVLVATPADAPSAGDGAPTAPLVTVPTPPPGEPSATAERESTPEATPEPERVETAVAITQVPAPAATRQPASEVTPAPAAPAATPLPEPPVLASHASVYDAVAAAFPEQPDRAYAVVLCESSGYPATNTGNGYYGLWQFDLPTWQSVGGTGLPSEASVAEQVQRARTLYERRGWSPWGCAP